MSEFIGSCISLISKSDIKYVGTLHEINSENSTVALENVKSFGTEGRRGNPDDEIPPNDQIYDYIVFRGSDVKDLTIVEPPKENKPQPPQMPNDPAILGVSQSLQLDLAVIAMMQHSGCKLLVIVQERKTMWTFSVAFLLSPYNLARPSPNPTRAARPHGAPGAPQAPPAGPQGAFPQPNQQQQQQQWRGPQGPQGPQQPPPFPPYGYPPPPQANSRFGPPAGPHGFPGAPPQFYGPPPPGWFPPPGQGFPQGPQGPQGPPGHFPPQPIGPPGQQQQQQQQQQQPQAQQQRSPETQAPSAPAKQQTESAQDNAAFPPKIPEQKPTSSANKTQGTEATAPPPPVDSKPDVAAATAPAQSQSKPPTGPKNTRVAVPLVPLHAKPGNAPSNLAQQQQTATQTAAAAVAAAMAKLPVSSAAPADAGIDNLTKRVGDMRTDDRTRHPRQPAPGGFAPGHRGGHGGRRPSNRDLVKPVEVPSADFDFETSNAKFNKQDMVKEAIATGSPLGTPTADEPQQAQNEASNGFEAPQAEREVVIPGATYNKSSSFFDNISSELKDRQAAQDDGRRMGGMEFRTEERKKNFETFGQANVDNGYRGGFRGRGRGRGYSRGGQRGGFAPRGGYAPRGRGASFAGDS
ncbi:hypothetical protein AUEXF2481DRAFT_26086 [Aureobasidium subglaciale EXF-2481]|uniref:DFDF domain-containing protein n=1 Tax=Aureobasidium subglaciale (strain EXF-2481) TaxID=1043005 RepID=A0A074ZK20_AURSE|nr:uncharacterized protein AUEXF2481DRAFT_26086 [Aureobasidium subglaciale EXF-2481]KAI5203724.1 hypothetical protein E4T38_04984 [Aureobasidium subglaciale]KAI5222236.1 hypothetical protein E4T40_05022 [Aureobasidium subglaciale]KAI5226376.1 hypothetical protein E4T41_04841 [Aureobasidium subglaciale]KAI5262056.1 hypothetical protein E4T46_04734 [Aureobasidium subglaciale]KEQ98836.1 hypothetical protein AUEXF2481DRAFT_26086 [Aureobasidium subglaciale EXF-2481]